MPSWRPHQKFDLHIHATAVCDPIGDNRRSARCLVLGFDHDGGDLVFAAGCKGELAVVVTVVVVAMDVDVDVTVVVT